MAAAAAGMSGRLRGHSVGIHMLRHPRTKWQQQQQQQQGENGVRIFGTHGI